MEALRRAEIKAAAARGEVIDELHPVVGAVICCVIKSRNLTSMATTINSVMRPKLPRSIAAVCKAVYTAVTPYLLKQRERKIKEQNGEKPEGLSFRETRARVLRICYFYLAYNSYGLYVMAYTVMA